MRKFYLFGLCLQAKRVSLLLIFSLALLCNGRLLAQGTIYRGKVTAGSPDSVVTGASVKIKGTNNAAITDEKGNFSISATSGQTLQVSAIGYGNYETVLGANTSIAISLTGEAGNLTDVVVVGYGSQRRTDLTGSVATVDVTKTFASKPLNDPAKALQGAVPGLTIQYGNGGLTAGADIKIRGVGTVSSSSGGRPLILVDNVQTDDLSLVNPNDIESMSVLKDAASASIYGARAAFGVILIKTKTGRRNQRTSISYNNYFSMSTPTTLPAFSDPVPELQALDDAAVRSNATRETFGMNLQTLKAGVQKWEQNYSGNTGLEMVKGQDWEINPTDGRTYFYKVWNPTNIMLNKYTFSNMHNISAQGGSDKLNWYIGGGYSYDGGILKINPDQVQKYNLTASVNASVTDWLDLNVKMLYRNFSYDYPFNYNNTTGYFYYFYRWGAYFPYGTYQGSSFRILSADLLRAANKSNLTDNYVRMDLGATIKLTKDLNIKADYSIVKENALRHDVGGPVVDWDFWTAGALNLTNIVSPTASNPAIDGVTYTSGNYKVNTLNAYATYQKTFGRDHHFKAIGGVNVDNNENINFSATRQGLLDPTQGELNLATGTQLVAGTSSAYFGQSNSGHGQKAYAGYFGRINYDYQDKYLLEFNERYDGSSSYPPNNRWALFTSGSVGWRISNENFWQSIKPAVSDLKLRASYGEIGNQDLGATNLYLATMAGSNTASGWINSTGIIASTVTQPAAVANGLSWERVSTLDLGLDARILHNHVGITFDWFERNTKGMIQATSVPATFGTTGPSVNAGNFRNRGYEISVDANYTIGRDFNLYGTIAFTDYKTVFTQWNNPNLSISNAAGINYVGKTYGEIWGLQTDRYFTSTDDLTKLPSQTALQNGNFVYGPGDVKYVDQNGDGKIDGGKSTLTDHGDLVVLGNTQPRYMYSVRLGASWKGFDVDIFFQGVGKRNIWGVGQTIIPLYQSVDILYANQLDFWSASNPDAYYPRPFVGNGTGKIAGISAGGNNFYPQSKYLLNMAYLRLKNATVGYTLPQNLLRRYGITKLRFFLTGENLITISHVGAPIDPETTDGENGFTGRTFPFQITYAAGLQLGF